MRELVAAAVVFVATKLLSPGDGQASLFSGFLIVVILAAIVYLSLAVTERFFLPQIKTWHRFPRDYHPLPPDEPENHSEEDPAPETLRDENGKD